MHVFIKKHIVILNDYFLTSIFPIIYYLILGKVKKQSILFNLSSVTSTSDRIKHAEVHVFSRKSRHGKVARAKFKLRISSSKRKHFSRTVVPLVPTKGWQILDITKTAEIFKGTPFHCS